MERKLSRGPRCYEGARILVASRKTLGDDQWGGTKSIRGCGGSASKMA